MKAIHITDTRPKTALGGDFALHDFELLCTILSALKWRQCNGSIKLYTDPVAYRLYEEQKMLDIWDAGIDCKSIGASAFDINPKIFWAASKLIALSLEEAPIVVIDTDMIVWQKLEQIGLEPESCICIHKEELHKDIYPDAPYLKCPPNYRFDPSWDWTVLPCNTALVYHGNRYLLEQYLHEAFRFMQQNNEEPKELVSQMVFAEQRLLGMLAHALQMEVQTFCNYEALNAQSHFTHLWGLKQVLRQDKKQAELLCRQFATRIVADYSSSQASILSIPVVNRYLK